MSLVGTLKGWWGAGVVQREPGSLQPIGASVCGRVTPEGKSLASEAEACGTAARAVPVAAGCCQRRG